MEAFDYTKKYCTVGAGCSGLAAAKNLKAHQIPCDVIEAEDDVGGNWYYGKPRSSVYRSTHLISSKPLTEYTDFPMPAHYPDYPSHAQVWEYLRSYAKTFGLYESIEFNTAVERIEKAGGFWEVTLNNNQTRRELFTAPAAAIITCRNISLQYRVSVHGQKISQLEQ
ncbi:NAD(P)-binding protein [candidate division KSB1 bacterium]|nr:NAD(P)-binding protein [candidate division KSB1 bacterium]